MELIDELADLRRSRRVIDARIKQIVAEIHKGTVPMCSQKNRAKIVRRVVLEQIAPDTYQVRTQPVAPFFSELEKRNGQPTGWDVV